MYQVILNGPTKIFPIHKKYVTRAQAIYGARLLAYSTLLGFGKLDTKTAYDCFAAIEGFTYDSLTINISNTGYTIRMYKAPSK